jgi:hypothetical protein
LLHNAADRLIIKETCTIRSKEQEVMARAEPARPARPAPLIRQTNLHGHRDGRFLLMLVAVFGSLIFHAALIGSMAFLLPAPASALPVEQVAQSNEANVQSEPPPEPASSDPLTITDIDPAAIAPDTEINYNVDRKADVSVPGVVNPDEPVGIENASQTAPPTNIPLTFGTGGGTGGALDVPGMTGNWNGPGSPGGYSLRAAPLAGSFYGRSGATRKKALEEGGGTAESEATVAAGLIWLIRVQSSDGSWRLDGNFKNKGQANDIAGTAFGLLPFLGAGKTHKAAKDNPYDKPIEKGLLFLLRKQDRKTGNFGGGMYGHCLATIAVCEDFGLTQDPLLRRPAQMAVNYILQAQHDLGGWRYSPREPGDTSVTGWAVMAIKSGKMAGLDVPEVTFRKAVRYLESCCDRNNEGYGYTGPGSSPTMSAVGLLCRQYLQAWGPNNPRLIKGIKNNIKPVMPPVPPARPTSMYYYYYATQVMHHFGGEEWKGWNARMRDSLIKSRDKSNNPTLKGSWDPSGDPHAGAGGRLMYTSLALLTLEVYYRHLPLYYREAGERKERALSTP